MTSKIVFMEHNPLTMLKKPISPSNLGSFTHRICSSPASLHNLYRVATYVPAEVSGMEYPRSGYFKLSFYEEALELAGVFFRNQETIDEYLLSRNIAIKRPLVDLNVVAARSMRGGGVLLFEKIKYSVTNNVKVTNMAKAMLRVSNDVQAGISGDSPLLRVRGGKLVHSRTGDSVPEDVWIPLYRPGTIFGEVPTDVPIDLESCDHVIF